MSIVSAFIFIAIVAAVYYTAMQQRQKINKRQLPREIEEVL